MIIKLLAKHFHKGDKSGFYSSGFCAIDNCLRDKPWEDSSPLEMITSVRYKNKIYDHPPYTAAIYHYDKAIADNKEPDEVIREIELTLQK